MQIIDNFSLPSRKRDDFNAWLERMFETMRSLSTSDFIVRLSGEHIGREVHYQLYNSQNKTYAAIQRFNGTVKLRLWQRLLPDPEIGFKPGVSEATIRSFPFTEAGRNQAAKVLQEWLDQLTPYSEQSVTKVKVTPTATPLEPWTFAGGQVSKLIPGDINLTVEVEDGEVTYVIPNDKLLNHRPSVSKFVLFNEDGDFQFISSTEFHFYFRMVNVQQVATH